MSDDVKYVWIDDEGDSWDYKPNTRQEEIYGPFTRYRLEPDPEPEPVLDEPTKPYAVVEVDGAFENAGERVRLIRAHCIDGTGEQNWVELVGGYNRQKYYVWTWENLSERNPKIIFEGVDL